ncbi:MULTISPECIES: ribonuclease E inhibitor RraB [unclassified Bradyrhizobium]|uniref:ribonuclease E inhibitor RraB n=1 Tax=unclassified Bradyrhizobium TaxID=2631580 RepID=UPI001BA9A8C0|nr:MULTISPECIES: ribonuclease E inhibitor RraB [unclassified Bradyrhizobium]MBR1208016.1 ribonuclease E inhibitor RraB [Bradyrhizobium sp. AUGA SZCCT0124]MBR1314476.1 ribonuclease E inhibitor RraB [Bradyrhizobium sp. AUGA SZCCT0051]MBR1342506.1 ribonuclease E inhibitor RraB [Bradyrhizobium sp. AUGA SZCCT0105]MBR1352736.1 ribonuclease E inhibitor RraB [Bradyrhizobium sp. AUGA SZCCT0045]
MDWPNDADGDVLRRLANDRFDFLTAHVVDFVIDFADRPSPEALTLLRQNYPLAVIHNDTEYGPNSLLIQLQSVVTYDFITTTQAGITELLKPFGGICESWGVMNEHPLP